MKAKRCASKCPACGKVFTGRNRYERVYKHLKYGCKIAETTRGYMAHMRERKVLNGS